MFVLVTLSNDDGLFLFKASDVRRALFTKGKLELTVGHIVYDVDMNVDQFYELLEVINEADLD